MHHLCSSLSGKDNDNFDWMSWAEQRGAASLSYILTIWQVLLYSFLEAKKGDYMNGWAWFVFRSLPLFIIPCNSLCGERTQLSFIVWQLQGRPEKRYQDNRAGKLSLCKKKKTNLSLSESERRCCKIWVSSLILQNTSDTYFRMSFKELWISQSNLL